MHSSKSYLQKTWLEISKSALMNNFHLFTEIENVKVEDQVTMIGKQGKLEISADDIAQKIGTINYEVVSGISSRIQRIVVK